MASGEISEEWVSKHVARCRTCRAAVERIATELRALRGSRQEPLVETSSPLAVEASGSRLSSLFRRNPVPPAEVIEGRIPDSIGRYLVLDELDRGGQSFVYRVIHRELGRDLALKIDRRPAAAGEAAREMIAAEAKVLSRLNYPGLIRVHDFDFHEGRPFLVMDFVQGVNLARYARDSRLSPRRSVSLVAEAARAVAAVNRAGILHQDIKPENILVDEQGHARVIDFGMAHWRNAWSDHLEGSIGGTVEYMPPEQAREDLDRIGPRSDVFALGGVLYFLLTGHAPFEAQSAAHSIDLASRCDFDRGALRTAKVPRRLGRICLKAMAEDPAERHQTADELADELDRFLAQPRRIAAQAVLLLVCALITLGWTFWPRDAPSFAKATSVSAPLSVATFAVDLHRRVPPSPLGTIGVEAFAGQFERDDVRVKARFNEPAYCYLIALNPDGGVQLCSPQTTALVPSPTTVVDYPPNPEDGYGLTDGIGLQAFVLIASRSPLPSFSIWLPKPEELRWAPTCSSSVWTYDGRTFEASDGHPDPNSQRGDVRQLTDLPGPLTAACRALQSRPGVDLIRVLAFPVNPAAGATGKASPGIDRKDLATGSLLTLVTLTCLDGTAQRASSGTLSEADTRAIDELSSSIEKSSRAGRFAEAVEPAIQAEAIMEKALGPDHWRSADARHRVATMKTIAGLSEEARKALAKALDLRRQFKEAYARYEWTLAERLARESIAVKSRWLGEQHLETAAGLIDLGNALRSQRKLAEAEIVIQRASAIRIKMLGENHPDTAASYHFLGGIAWSKGGLDEAERLTRLGLSIRLKTLGEDHPDIASSCYILSVILTLTQRHPDAEAMIRRALVIWLKERGENHRDTATGYDDLGNILRNQGKFAEAEAMHRRGLAIRLKLLGEEGFASDSYNNLAMGLRLQGKLAEAEAMHRRALAIRLRLLGEDNISTSNSYFNLAQVLDSEGKPDEAEAMYRHALASKIKTLGEAHFDPAITYHYLAGAVEAQDRLPEAEVLHKKSLALCLKAYGDNNPWTALCHTGLADTLEKLGRSDEALTTRIAAVEVMERARLRDATGLETALRIESSPSPALAVALARAGRSREAWDRWEQGLARAVLDEVAGRASRPLTADERAREADLYRKSQALDERIGQLAGKQALSQDDEANLERLRKQAGELRRQLLEFQEQLEQKYGPAAGRPATLEEVQASIPDDAALIGWVDTKLHHAACVVRRTGEPSWVTIHGDGPNGTWTSEDHKAASRLRDQLASHAPGDDGNTLAKDVANRRLGPLKPLLKGARRLIVVNSPGLAGVPVEVLLKFQSEEIVSTPVVTYAPSGSMYAHLARSRPRDDRPDTLFALGDPAYPLPTSAPEKSPTPPGHGLLVVETDANGVADLFGIRAGDILMEYHGKPLTSRDDLRPLSLNSEIKAVRIRIWRAGEERTVEAAVGPLGIRFDSKPAAQVVMADRAVAQVLAMSRDSSKVRLPGTRREVEAIARLFPEGRVNSLLGDQARESIVQGLTEKGALKAFRYLHFAAHGRLVPGAAYRTALLLAPDFNTNVATDGEISAEQIARTWDLNADLVVLSACESGLGVQNNGEGFLGFSQPLLARGARGVVLSLWKVDDAATSLLMVRFYQNLLGKRPGLTTSMSRAEALDDAKHWLRDLSSAEIDQEIAAQDRGTIRPLASSVTTTSEAATRRPATGPRPYSHPYYWAGFILIADLS